MDVCIGKERQKENGRRRKIDEIERDHESQNVMHLQDAQPLERDPECQNSDLILSSIFRKDEHQKQMNETNEPTETTASYSTLYDLPLEILDIILKKSYLHWIFNAQTKQRDEEIIRSLTSVDVCFYRRITRRRLKNAIWRYLKDFYGQTRKRYEIVRNNRNYLLENIQPNDEFIHLLLNHNCITEEQSHLIQRQRSNRDKNTELLYVAESFDETKFIKLMKCLRETNQMTVAKIIENGGVVLKVEIQNREGAPKDTQLIHQNLEDLRNKRKPWSSRTDKLIGQLRAEGIEIINSQLERQTVIVWIWCHSQSALEHIQTLYESNQLKDVLFGVGNIPSSTSENVASNVINIYSIAFKTTIVGYSISVGFAERIDVERHERIHGVIKARHEIYVVCGSYPNVIRVFEDQNPFQFLDKIEIREIEPRGYILFSEYQNCFYVGGEEATGLRVNYARPPMKPLNVWKITREAVGQHQVTKWLTTDHGSSLMLMSSDDEMIITSQFSFILKIYGSNAELIRSIQLSRDVFWHTIHHAVESSVGNFIILHCMREMIENRRNWNQKWFISELTGDGQMIVRRFIPSNETQQLNNPQHLSIDSDDRVFVADAGNGRVILLDSDLKWNRIICPTGKEKKEKWIRGPQSLFYDKAKNQLIVGDYSAEVSVYTLSLK